ncbi:hypothetical protein [uncultured Acetobacteroides sp.]|uniref:hypothetical protein n=1 Tax=uncultured Acetobacteroides sp. TaxID=1760811 RepID=UPI0029F4A25F|nr:hypothetical protein [uncultured Acetobacteroides sp.]
MRKVLLLLVIASFLGACGEYEEENSNNNTLNVTTNKEFIISDGIFLKVREVVDMRKPIKSNRKWEGEAKLRIQLYTGKRSVDTAISTNFPNEIVLDGVRLKLNSVYPYPEYDKVRSQSDYVIQLSFDKEK